MLVCVTKKGGKKNKLSILYIPSTSPCMCVFLFGCVDIHAKVDIRQTTVVAVSNMKVEHGGSLDGSGGGTEEGMAIRVHRWWQYAIKNRGQTT